MKIIVCVWLELITDALWEHVPSSNFYQGISRVQLGESQVKLGTQILLGDEQTNMWWKLSSAERPADKTPTQVFSCEYCEIPKNTYFEKHLRTAASQMLTSTPWHHLSTMESGNNCSKFLMQAPKCKLTFTN